MADYRSEQVQKQELSDVGTFRLYSLSAISIVTFIGGPLAAGILIRKNFINLGHEQLGRNALVISVIATIVLFGTLFSLPEDIVDKIPNSIIPLIYTGIVYLISDKYQGVALKEHKHNNRPFYSAWKAAGIGAICLLLYLVVLAGYFYLSPDEFI
jgi:hypothetical protein